MASRNERKSPDAPGALFHVYNRRVARQPIFRSGSDYAQFLDGFRRHLSAEPIQDAFRKKYRKLDDAVSLVAFCLMPNHFHLVLRQNTAEGMESLMRSAMVGYVGGFNRKYGREGPLFQGRYKARLIDSHDYARSVVSYVHLNHPDGVGYRYTSHLNYMGERSADWIDTEDGLALFGGRDEYQRYILRALAKREPLS